MNVIFLKCFTHFSFNQNLRQLRDERVVEDEESNNAYDGGCVVELDRPEKCR